MEESPTPAALRAGQAAFRDARINPFSGDAIDALAGQLENAQSALAASLDALTKADGRAGRRGMAVELRSLAEHAQELRGVVAELLEDCAIAWLRATERIDGAAHRLAEAGPPSEIAARLPAEAASSVGLERVVLSRVVDGRLVAEAVHCRSEEDGSALLARLREGSVELRYPLVEAELLRRRQAQIVAGREAQEQGRGAFAAALGSAEYIAAPIVLAGRTVGFLHGDRGASGAPLGGLERDGLRRIADAFAGAFERAVLRQRLRIQRQELRQVASWADARTGALSDAAIDLSIDPDLGDPEVALHGAAADSQLRELLTKRELDVLEEMVGGGSNAEIARALVVSQSTVKFHVKNILRKLNASNRGEAISRYLQLGMRSNDAA